METGWDKHNADESTLRLLYQPSCLRARQCDVYRRYQHRNKSTPVLSLVTPLHRRLPIPALPVRSHLAADYDAYPQSAVLHNRHNAYHIPR